MDFFTHKEGSKSTTISQSRGVENPSFDPCHRSGHGDVESLGVWIICERIAHVLDVLLLSMT
jgi:hypothetical protein